MHVLQVIDGIGASGGAERSLASMASWYTARGVTLDVVYLAPRTGLQAEIEGAGARLFSLVGRGGLLGWTWRLRRLVLERRPDLVHTTLFDSDVAGRVAGALSRVPVVSSLVNVPYGHEHIHDPSLSSWKVRAARGLDRATARIVTRFHAISVHVADVMSLRLRIPRDRIDVVPRGRDPEKLGVRTPERRAAARARLGIDAADPVLLMAARHEYQKGVDVLLEALPLTLRAVPRTCLLIAGRSGKLSARLEATTRRLGLERNVRLLGTRSDVPDLMCAADVFVVSSRWEGFGGALLEAMALETPIVASDIPPVREVLGDERAGVMVPVGDPESLAKGVVATINNPEQAAEAARHARRRFLSEFTSDIVADRMIGFYEKALS
jgi:glycosyltransferase involved in cell wall biosynthesis